MPASISVDQLDGLLRLVGQGDISTAYAYLSERGYAYASWANGVATANSLAGASAIAYLQNSAMIGLGSEACKMLDESQIQKIRSDMAVGYLEALARQLDNGNAVTMDVTASEAAAFHERAFDANRLGIENWTLDIPFKLLEKNGGPAAVERYWRGMLETRGTGVDALVANTSTYALVLGATYSKDPETRALAQQWLNTVPGIASGPAIGGLGNAILRLVKEGHIDPLATDMKQMLRDMGGQLDRLMDRLGVPGRVVPKRDPGRVGENGMLQRLNEAVDRTAPWARVPGATRRTGCLEFGAVQKARSIGGDRRGTKGKWLESRCDLVRASFSSSRDLHVSDSYTGGGV